METDNRFCEEVKERASIREVISHFHQEPNRSNKVACPFHNEKTPSLSVKEEEKMFKCFGCGVGGDCISFVAKLKDIGNFEAAKLINDELRLGVSLDNDVKPTKKTKVVKKNIEPKQEQDTELFVPNENIKPYLQECAKNIEKQNYMQSRGLTLETLKKFKIGYDIQHNAITIPYSNSLTYYQTRRIDEKKFYKPLAKDAGTEPIYNERALYQKIRIPIFVVESPICAMSITQEGGLAIATCGTGCINKLKSALKSVKPKGTLILCMDNDEPGIKATQEIVEELKKLDIKYLTYNIAPGVKDPNEMLTTDKDRFQFLIQDAMDKAKRLTATKYDLQSAYELSKRDIPDPYWVIDEILPEGLTLLAAASKIGKSWMAQQMCIEIARGGKFLGYQTHQSSTVYLALEDSDRRVKSRMKIYLNGDEVPLGYKYCICAPRLDNGLTDVLEMYLQEDPSIKLIVIDTLQMIRGVPLKNENAYATDYREMNLLKDITNKYHICILVLHHLRKAEDKSDNFNKVSGTNGIIGVSDTPWIIMKNSRMDDDATLSITGRDVDQTELVITKGKKNGRWDVVGSVEDQEYQKKRTEYLNNPIVKVIKALLERQPGGWQGTVTEFKIESIQIIQIPLGSDTKVGLEMNKLTYDLALDGIVHEVDEKRSARGRVHKFFNKNRYTGKPIVDVEMEQQELEIE